ncbi:hypothetical protein BW723_13180 [Polaribacter reichenbachii]|uniref:DUF3857 domain-containing protein n=1 Tax=Polaribacter reichenbachii TaxID=996801 RepID=A0A1B8TZV7_9FLAO|nr:hypothetical protein [Polaribacter reichenbachii]APZ47178.1 hypothetical protein BW723_13180 [Polaribacter reichenbachii]AUC17818.1 hypothetical protein BTO17_03625 [Polaribacter reichenbachii]OBY65158.1 hypothetical protein LPB301_08600 [Polaribacter reichenbachii]
MKKIPLILLLIATIIVNAQAEKSSKMGQTTLGELKMKTYDKDSTAAAVVLYEHANVYLDPKNDYKTRTDYYFRIKILDKSAFDLADITLELYKEKKVLNIKAITYNSSEIGSLNRTHLAKDKIFVVNENEYWTTHRFTLPNIKEGSVIEYSYSIISPYSGISDWNFQADIPKIKSEFDAAILGNYKYNIRIVGFLKLDKNDSSIKKNCIDIEGLGPGSCRIYSFGINDIPAFKEEDYMLSKKNYMSRISFDLETYTSPRGVIEKYTTTWKEADKKLKKIFLNNQTSKKSFFKKRIPEEILTLENNLEKAKGIYTFIQNHYTWNDKYWNNEDEKVKKAFDNKVGSAGEINLSLYNALIAAEIQADLVILSTRKNGVPTKLYPVIFDYNYVIIKATINEKEYFLDATDKYLPFGEVPIRTLNGEARVINYKKESSWVTLKPRFKSTNNVTAKLTLSEDGEFSGNLLIKKRGYSAKKQREKLNLLTEDDYLEEFEEENPDVEVDNYRVNFLDELDKPLQEIYAINIMMGEDLSKKTRINPFFFDRMKENPFTLKERYYPVDFGYASKNNFSLSLEIPDSYKITQLPKEVAISLPNNGGLFVLKIVKKENIINLYTRINLNKSIYTSEEYFALKEFFNQIVIAENSYITLEKK